MKCMAIGGPSGRLRQPQKGDAVGLTLGPKSSLRSHKSSTGFSFRQKRGVLYSLLTSADLLLLARDEPEIFSQQL